MLQVLSLPQLSLKSEILKNYSPESQTWVVSDLRSKFEIQNFILSQNPGFEDLSVMRVSELWKLLLRRQKPELHWVSPDFVKAFVRDAIKEKKLNSFLSEGSLLELIEQFSPLLSHPDGAEQLRSWLEANPSSAERWSEVFEVAYELFQKMRQQNWVTANWAPGLLSNEKKLNHIWDRSLIFDLGADLSLIEAEIIQHLAKDLDILVIEPFPEFREKFSHRLKAYENLRALDLKWKNPLTAKNFSASEKSFKFASSLAEVKQATAQVRLWLEQGVPASQVSVIAPDIELYWPLLQAYFQNEGLPVNKDLVAKMQSLPVINQWMSRFRVLLGSLNFGDLESSYYQRTDGAELRFEEFYSYFATLLGPEDLVRHDLVKKAFHTNYEPQQIIERDEWIGLCLREWSSQPGLPHLENLLREILTNVSHSMKLSLSAWVFYLEQIISHKEVRLQSAVTEGVQLVNLSSADTELFKKRIFLGLAESQLKDSRRRLISTSEIQRLALDLGFFLEHPEQNAKEFDLRWVNEKITAESHFYFSQTSLTGGAEAPSLFWLERTKDHNLLSLPLESRWDQLQTQEPPEKISQVLKRDLGLESVAPVTIPNHLKLSPSSIESYLDCPFTFAAERLFRLKDEPLLDLELDQRSSGSLVHLLFEALTLEPRRFDYSELELRELISQLRRQSTVPIFDENFWSAYENRLLKIAERFLQFEKQWKKDFPDTMVLEREKNFEFYFDVKNKKFLKEAPAQGFHIRGKIDRIDQTAHGLVVIDYKRSRSGFSAVKSWIKNRQIQLLIYALAVREHLVETSGDLQGAYYYFYRNFDRTLGLDSGDSETLFKELQESLSTLFEKLLDGQIAPVPADKKICPTCHWKNLCRAPHLN